VEKVGKAVGKVNTDRLEPKAGVALAVALSRCSHLRAFLCAFAQLCVSVCRVDGLRCMCACACPPSESPPLSYYLLIVGRCVGTWLMYPTMWYDLHIAAAPDITASQTHATQQVVKRSGIPLFGSRGGRDVGVKKGSVPVRRPSILEA
jgi:hypothetical protein